MIVKEKIYIPRVFYVYRNYVELLKERIIPKK